MAKLYSAAAFEIVGSLASVGMATATLMDKVARADMEYQKFALRMYMTKDAAKQLKIVTDAMGQSMDDIAWNPELLSNYRLLIAEAQKMETPKEAGGYLMKIRNTRLEFTRLKVEATYGLQWISMYLSKYLQDPVNGIKLSLKEMNDWIRDNIHLWTEKIARGLTLIINVGKNAFRALEAIYNIVKKLWDAMGGLNKVLLVTTGLVMALFIMGPWGRAVTIISGLLLLIDDFYAWLDGRKSSPQLAPIWHALFSLSKEIPKFLNEMNRAFANLFGILSKDDSLKNTKIELMGIKDALSLMFAAPIAGVHALVMGIKAIVGLPSVLWSVVGGDIAGAEKKLNALSASLGRNITAINNLGVPNTLGLGGQAPAVAPPKELGGPPTKYDAEIMAASKKHGVDPNLIKAVIKQESNFKSNAKSNKGALGLMQMLPSTAADMGVDDLLDPSQNIEGGAKYLSWLYNRYRDWGKAVAAYHGGPKDIDRGFYGPRTQNYLNRVRGFYQDFSGLAWAPNTPTEAGQVSTQNNINFNISGVQDPQTVANLVVAKLKIAGMYEREALGSPQTP
jgi:hypothetical protein